MDGVRLLREQRGAERVTFNDVADHLVDFADRHADLRDAVDRLARFLAEVEQSPHEHENDAERGVAGTPEEQVPQV